MNSQQAITRTQNKYIEHNWGRQIGRIPLTTQNAAEFFCFCFSLSKASESSGILANSIYEQYTIQIEHAITKISGRSRPIEDPKTNRQDH